MQKPIKTRWIVLGSMGGYLIAKLLVNMPSGPPQGAKDLAKTGPIATESVARKKESQVQSIQLEAKQAEREAERRRREAEREAEKQRRQNIPMGTPTPVRDNRVLTVTDARLYDYLSANNQFAPGIEAQGGKLLVAYLEIENTGSSSGDMAWTFFQVEDDNGHTYDELKGESFALAMWAEEQGLGDSTDQLFPGQSKRIAKVFRVRSGATGLKLAANEYKFLLYN